MYGVETMERIFEMCHTVAEKMVFRDSWKDSWKETYHTNQNIYSCMQVHMYMYVCI